MASLALFALAVLAHARYALDAHVHFHDATDERGQEHFLAADQFERGFLISPSYAYHAYRFVQPGDEALRDESQIPVVNARVAAFIAAHPGRFVGLCGVNLRWADPAAYVVPCLDLDGMRGLKIHSEDADAFVDEPAYLARADRLFGLVEARRPFVLWHLEPEREPDAVFDLARRHPRVTFILAHSMYSAAAVRRWHARERSEGTLDNVYLEISTFYRNFERTLYPEVVDAWRAFGMHRVLFGSDLGFMGAGEQRDLSETIRRSADLTAAEKQAVLDDNGRRILHRLGL